MVSNHWLSNDKLCLQSNSMSRFLSFSHDVAMCLSSFLASFSSLPLASLKLLAPTQQKRIIEKIYRLSLSICLNKQISKINFTIFLLGSSLSLSLSFCPNYLYVSSEKRMRAASSSISSKAEFLLSIFRMILKIKLFTYQFILRLPLFPFLL